MDSQIHMVAYEKNEHPPQWVPGARGRYWFTFLVTGTSFCVFSPQHLRLKSLSSNDRFTLGFKEPHCPCSDF